MKLALVLIFAPGQVLVTDGLVHDFVRRKMVTWMLPCFAKSQEV